MKTEIRNALRFPAIALIAVLTATQTSFAADVSFAIDGQDPATQAAQQAIASQQNAMQQAQQANQQAMQNAQQANEAAVQAAQMNNTTGGVSTSMPHRQTVATALTGGPVPAKIAAAHTVYFQNDGTDPRFPVDETLAVHDTFTALQAWGHYQLVDNPNDADLIFVMHNAAPISGEWTSDDGTTYTFTSPTFVLTIVDAKTNATLWVMTSPVPVQGSGKTAAKWFALGVENFVTRLKVLVGQVPSTEEAADLLKVPQSHYGRNAAIIVGGTVALGVAGGLILHHEFEKSVDQQKQNAAQWCITNGFPVIDCTA